MYNLSQFNVTYRNDNVTVLQTNYASRVTVGLQLSQSRAQALVLIGDAVDQKTVGIIAACAVAPRRSEASHNSA
jgi:hypothetical protein